MKKSIITTYLALGALLIGCDTEKEEKEQLGKLASKMADTTEAWTNNLERSGYQPYKRDLNEIDEFQDKMHDEFSKWHTQATVRIYSCKCFNKDSTEFQWRLSSENRVRDDRYSQVDTTIYRGPCPSR